MKPFDLEKALAGEPVVTREGREIKQLTVFAIPAEFCLYGIIGDELHTWTSQGRFSSGSGHPKDLFMKSKKVVKWAVMVVGGYWLIYEENDGKRAKEYAAQVNCVGNKAHKIEWKE